MRCGVRRFLSASSNAFCSSTDSVLALVTRLFKTPVSLAVKGESSAGKSHTTQETLNFFPAASYYALTGMSDKALVYSQEPLKHRFLVVYEAEGTATRVATYFIRSLLSEGCIKWKTNVQTPNGWQPKELFIEGPTGLLTTTTLVSLHPENETRLLSVPVDDSPEQTRRIMRAMVSDECETPIDYAPWHAFQQWLAVDPPTVTIPFGAKLSETAFAGSVRVRRDFKKLLTLVRAHALMHQATRDRAANGAIVATLADYEAVRSLVEDLIAEAAEASVSEAVRETVAAVGKLAAGGFAEVSVTALAAELGIDKSSATRRAKVAIEKGYLRNLEERKGLPARLVPGDPLPQEQPVLPRAEDLAA